MHDLQNSDEPRHGRIFDFMRQLEVAQTVSERSKATEQRLSDTQHVGAFQNLALHSFKAPQSA